MSIEELLSFIKQELNGCQSYIFIDRTLSDLRNAMSKREYFKPEKFKNWFIEKNVIYKNSPLAFLTKCGIADIESGMFDKEIIPSFTFTSLVNNLQSRGIVCDTQEDTFLRLDVYFTYIYNHDLMSMEEIRHWLNQASVYIETHSKDASSFKELLFKSKSIKMLNLPYSELEAEVEKTNKEWNDLVAKLEKDRKDKKDDDDNLPFEVDGNPQESETKNEKEEINN